jgi:hypothetical protein
MTASEVHSALAEREPDATYRQVRTALQNMSHVGFVEADRPADAPDRYRLIRTDVVSDVDRHAQYAAAYPEGREFTAHEVAVRMGVRDDAAKLHLWRAVREGALVKVHAGREVHFRRAEP